MFDKQDGIYGMLPEEKIAPEAKILRDIYRKKPGGAAAIRL